MRKCLLPLLIFFLTTAPAYSQQYTFHNYSVSEGLPQSQVFCIIEDSRGYLWMGTRGGGLSRFDGINFHNYSREDGLPSNYIRSLLEASDSSLWIGSETGVVRFDGVAFTPILFPQQEPQIRQIVQDKDGIIWLATDYGLFYCNETDTICKQTNITSPLSCLLVDPEGILWIGGQAGLEKLGSKDTIEYILTNNDIACISIDQFGSVWVGLAGGIVNIIRKDTIINVNTEYGVLGSTIRSIYCDSKNFTWITTRNRGVYYWDPVDSSFNNLTEDDGLCNDNVVVTFEDSWENLWFGTSGGGVCKYAGQQFKIYTRSDGLAGNYIYSIYKDSRKRLWIGTSGGGVMMKDSTSMVHLDSDSGLVVRKVRSITEDIAGTIWLGSETYGLVSYDGHSFTYYNISNGLSGNWVYDILEDRFGDLYVATARNGITKMTWMDSCIQKKQDVIRINRKSGKIDTISGTTDSTVVYYTFSYFNESNGFPIMRINCLEQDQYNRIWFGTEDKGLGCLQNDSLILRIDKTQGLTANTIRSLTMDRSGNLWIGSSNGLSRIDLEKGMEITETYDRRSGLWSNNIYLLHYDESGALWIGTESGIDQATLDTEGNIIEFEHFGKQEGFAGIETCQNAVEEDGSGNLWFGTVNGLTKYNPATSIKNPIPPKTSISRINLFYEPLSNTDFGEWIGAWGMLKEGLELPYNQNHLSFDFIGINHTNPEKVTYSWKLDGFDKDWSPPSRQQRATYSYLSPGSYTFLLKAANEDNIWNPEPQKISFIVQEPFWKTWWFSISWISFIVIVILILLRARVTSVRRKANLRHERLLMEKELLELEQKTLRLQMNPHFIFNALNSVQAFIVKEEDKTARYLLAKFSNLMRAVLENSKKKFITLEQEIKTLDQYLTIEKISRDSSFDYEINVPQELHTDDISIPPMLIQPFIENAIIHGIAQVSYKGIITISFDLKEGYLLCLITDNGVGREHAKELKSQIHHHHKSRALELIQSRLEIIGNGQEESLLFNDLLNEDGSPCGTEVVMRIPFQ